MGKPKTYRGDPVENSVTVDGMELPTYYKEVSHSREFAWGYAGSGPAQLAYAILRDHSGSQMLAALAHQDFKSEFVARFKGDEPWELTSEQIESSQTLKNLLAESVMHE